MLYIDSALEGVKSFISRLQHSSEYILLRNGKQLFKNSTKQTFLVFKTLTSCWPESTSSRSRRMWPFLMSVKRSETAEGGVCCRRPQEKTISVSRQHNVFHEVTGML